MKLQEGHEEHRPLRQPEDLDGKEKDGAASHKKIESVPQKRAIVISDGSFLLRAPGGLSPERSDGKKPAGAAAVVQIESPGHPYPATIVSCHEWLHGSFGAELHALAIGVYTAGFRLPLNMSVSISH